MTTEEVAVALRMVQGGWRPDQTLCEEWLAAIQAKNAEIARLQSLLAADYYGVPLKTVETANVRLDDA